MRREAELTPFAVNVEGYMTLPMSDRERIHAWLGPEIMELGVYRYEVTGEGAVVLTVVRDENGEVMHEGRVVLYRDVVWHPQSPPPIVHFPAKEDT